MTGAERAVWAAAFGWAVAWGHDAERAWFTADNAVKLYREQLVKRGLSDG